MDLSANQINNPLVSICVITFNSAKFVTETLNSAYNQTYKNIELIISDDCSIDNTLKICRKWIDENGSRFVRCVLLTSLKNEGVTINFRKSIEVSNGMFLKHIAADDTLCPDCIKDNVNFCMTHPSAQIVHSVSYVYRNIINKENFFEIRNGAPHIFLSNKIQANDQYTYLLRHFIISSPTLFLKKDLYNIYNYDVEIPDIEDVPFILNLTRNGIKLWFMNIHTVNYRIHDDSICHNKQPGRIYSRYFIKRRVVNKKYILPYMYPIEKIFMHIEYCRMKFITNHNLDSNTLLARLFLYLTRLPYRMFLFYDRRIMRCYIARKYKKPYKI
ncbi:MAG: glycosyltransferase [Pseudomonadota bacterium]